MEIRVIQPHQKKLYNKLVTHVIQSWEWGEFRKKLGLQLLRFGLYDQGTCKAAFQLTTHPIPFTPYSVGYLPKGPLPDQLFTDVLSQVAKQHKLAFIKLEPHVRNQSEAQRLVDKRLKVSPKPLFTQHNFVLDLTPSEEELLTRMHPKTRYNIKVAQKHGVVIEARTDEEAFQIYLKLYFETTKRQHYHGHSEAYHRLAWETLKKEGMAFIVIAFYTPEGTTAKIPLTAWMLMAFQDTLYYPYGGSSVEYRSVMSNNLVAWEAIKLGKKMGLKRFDMWGALSDNPDPKDPFLGFHTFKKGYGGELVEYLPTYDLIINYPIYLLFNLINNMTGLKVFLLKLLGK